MNDRRLIEEYLPIGTIGDEVVRYHNIAADGIITAVSLVERRG
jgi:hypothetical protein